MDLAAVYAGGVQMIVRMTGRSSLRRAIISKP
jgi:hypothetical protein